ncbi:alpha/beta fold hydrolase [Paludibacterium paludis]|uniref:Hydrolase n=1 Tax=Paludibacterium paludis TaxID=1225769 RepID=A0A918U7E9_9NEIS|nr:alpha/beta hydrolase [Paludibacterium paludis]GGY04252.1 hydrolase [Paludibacterium paludis]
MLDCKAVHSFFTTMFATRSEHAVLNGRRHHIRHWGNESAPPLFLLHGWMDSSATFRFATADLEHDWHLIAPDWRGFGDSEWNAGGYYFPDYLADLDALLERVSPKAPVRLAGHSMGAMIAGIYSGVRPERVAAVALLEGFGLPATQPAEAPGRYARWLKEQRQPPAFMALDSLDGVAARLIERNPRMAPQHAAWIAGELTRPGPDGKPVYRADPRHKGVNPVLYRLEEAMACWRNIRCPVLWVIAGDTADHPLARGVADTLDERRAQFARLEEVTLPDAGHMLQWEQPEAFSRTLAEFFRKTREG